LASKATGYPIAKVATKIAIGYTLDEIENNITKKTLACFEPVLDYVIVKIPKWPFNKFITATKELGTQMKATGEVMAIDTNLESAIMKAIRSLEENIDSLLLPKLEEYSDSELREQLKHKDSERLWIIAENIRRGITIDEIHNITMIDKFFLNKIYNIVRMEEKLKQRELTKELLEKAKQLGFTDSTIAKLSDISEKKVKKMRLDNKITANYKMVDTCALESDVQTPYYYSSYNTENEVNLLRK